MPGEVTLDRRTTLHLFPTEAQQKVRDPWKLQRRASEMARLGRPGENTHAGLYCTGDAWILAPVDTDLSNLALSDYASSDIGPADVNVAAGVTSHNFHRKKTETGVDANTRVVDVGIPMFTKTVATGASWNSVLTADTLAYPKPDLAPSHYPVDRILSGKKTYVANAPFAVQFIGAGLENAGTILSFYFGGPTELDPEDGHAGEYCVSFRDDGSAQLHEKNGDGWELRFAFTWLDSLATRAGNAAVMIVPYGNDRMLFQVGSSGDGGAPQSSSPVERWANLAAGAITKKAKRVRYRETRASAKHTHRTRMTGAGPVRVDVRRDLRLPFGLRQLRFPTVGTLIDDPFHLPFPVTEGMKLTITADVSIPDGTELVATLHRADDGSALSQDEDGIWDLEPGVNDYYIIWDMNCPDQLETPVLQSYEVSVPGLIETTTPFEVALDIDHEHGVQIVGAGSDPATGSALVVVKDIPGARFGDADILQARGRIKAQIRTYSVSTPSVYSVLFEGETPQDGVDASLRVTGDNYALDSWFEYGVPIGPEWGRVADQFDWSLHRFLVDMDADPDPKTGQKPPWKITSIIRYLFNLAGVTDEFLDIPDLEERLWVGQGFEIEDFMLQPAVKFGQAILKYARDFLDMWVCYDPNTNPGKWRLLYQPAPPYVPLHEFVLGAPVAGRLANHGGSYGAETSFILSETYRIRPVSPEANYILVVGMAGSLVDTASAKAVVAYDWNPNSFNFDPAHPTAITDPSDPRYVDYLGKKVPLLYVDPSIRTSEGAKYLARRLALKVAYGHKRVHFRAPLALVIDPTDSLQARPRPLRVGDAITVPVDKFGTPGTAIIDQAPSIEYHTDEIQWADYECRIARDG